jgi:CheY-like chemotaxis protein
MNGSGSTSKARGRAAGQSSADAAQRAEQERQQQLNALLDMLDARDAADDERESRRAMRCSFRRFGLSMTINHPGGSSTTRKVLTRDLSAGGLSFINNGYLHTGTRIDAALRRYLGGEDPVHGQVMYCEHISGSWHTVGVKFDRKIFPKLYLDPEIAITLTASNTSPQALVGRVLLLEDNELDRRLFAHHLRRTRIELTGVGTLAETLEAINGHSGDDAYDLIIVDLSLAGKEGDVDPVEVVRRTVEAAQPVPVAVCSAETSSAVLAEVQEVGARGVLQKPYDSERLLTVVGGWLSTTEVTDEPVFSRMAKQPEMKSLVTAYVETAKKQAAELAKALNNEDLDACRRTALALRGSGTSYGFDAVTEAASDAVKAIEATMSPKESAVQIARLQDVCSRMVDDEPE